VREVFTGRDTVVAVLLGLTVAALVWGPVLLRPLGYAPSPNLQPFPPVHIPRPATARSSISSPRVAKIKPDKPVNINRADVASLQALPGIGPNLAKRIVSHRQASGLFTEPDQLMEVEGIGAKRFETLKSWIEVR